MRPNGCQDFYAHGFATVHDDACRRNGEQDLAGGYGQISLRRRLVGDTREFQSGFLSKVFTDEPVDRCDGRVSGIVRIGRAKVDEVTNGLDRRIGSNRRTSAIL